jgi:hypothetical protein
MYVPNENISPEARIWIYQSDRVLTSEEEEKIKQMAEEFLTSWTAHQNELKASFEIRDHLFLIIQLDEDYNSASGCSIDKSIHFINKVERNFSLNLLDRQIFAFKEDEKIKLAKRKEFESLIEEGVIKDNTIVFNNLIQKKKELNSKWQIPFKDSWHGAIATKK